MFKTTIGYYIKKFRDAHQYPDDTITWHDFSHCFTGSRAGFDNVDYPFPPGYMPWSSSIIDPDKRPLLLDTYKRDAYVQRLFEDPEIHRRTLCNRNEMLAGFAMTTRSMDRAYGYCLQTPHAAAVFSNDADIPFYIDDHLIREHKIYLTSLMMQQNFHTPLLDMDEQSLCSFPEDGQEFDTSLKNCLQPCDDFKDNGNQILLFCLSKNWMHDEKLPGGISYSNKKTTIGSPMPLVFNQPEDHMLYGPKLEVIVIDRPTYTESFEMCMDKYVTHEWENVYLKNPSPYIERLGKNLSIEVASPYEESIIYHTYLGWHDLFVVPEERVKARMTMPVSQFLNNYKTKPEALKTFIQKELQPV